LDRIRITYVIAIGRLMAGQEVALRRLLRIIRALDGIRNGGQLSEVSFADCGSLLQRIHGGIQVVFAFSITVSACSLLGASGARLNYTTLAGF
jgi:hypothetical protein